MPMTTIFENDMKCLFCGSDVAIFGAYACTNEDCTAGYFWSGEVVMEQMPEWYEPDGSIPRVLEHNHGVYWYWCPFHEEYERDSPFGVSTCVEQIQTMTALLSG